MTPIAIDGRILAAASTSWRKIAMIIAIVLTDREMSVVDESSVANRIEALIESGQLEVLGNIQDWRHSEIRVVASK